MLKSGLSQLPSSTMEAEDRKRLKGIGAPTTFQGYGIE